MSKHVCHILFMACLFTGQLIYGQANDEDDPLRSPDNREKVLQDLTHKAKRNLFVMLKVGQEVLTEAEVHTFITEQARILKDGTPVYASRIDTTSLIEFVNRDETYPALERQPGYIRIQLSGEKDGWIYSGAALVTGSRPSNKPSGPLSNNTARLVEVIHRLYESMEDLGRKFQKAYGDISVPTDKNKNLQKAFTGYLTNARQYYRSHFTDTSAESPVYASAVNRFSAELSLATGSSTFRDDYAESLREEFKGRVTDVSLKGLYRIDEMSTADLLIDTRSELLETPYKSNTYQFGYRRNLEVTQFAASAGLNQYKDSFRGINSYDRLGVNARIKHDLNRNNALSLQYQLISNRYASENTTDYSRHHVTAGTESRLKNHNMFLFLLRGNLSSSDNDQLNFLHVLPSVTYRKIKPDASTDYAFSFEAFSYDNLALRNSIRGNFGISGRKRRELGKTTRNDILFSYIMYPENSNIDHFRLSVTTASHNFVIGNTFSTFGFTTKYFQSNPEASYADLRYDAGAAGKVFTQLSFFNRLYYPGEKVLTLTEANFKLGFEIEGFKIGPVLSVRGNIDFSDVSVEADGNYYRLGAFVQGSKTFKNRLRLAINGAYEYGNVYSEDISIDPNTGLINSGDVISRNPTTLRFSIQAGYTIMHLFDVFANADYYKIERDHQAVAGLNPVLSSDRLSFKFGFVYKYN